MSPAREFWAECRGDLEVSLRPRDFRQLGTALFAKPPNMREQQVGGVKKYAKQSGHFELGRSLVTKISERIDGPNTSN